MKPRPPAPLRLGPLTLRALSGSVDAAGLWRWRVEWYPAGSGGAMRTQGLGRCDADEALRRAARILAAGLPEEQHDPQEVRTVRDLLECWLGVQVERVTSGELSAVSCDSYERHARRVLGELGAVTLLAWTVGVAERYQRRRLTAGDAPLTVRQDLLMVRMAGRWAVEQGLVDRELAVPRSRASTVRPKPIPAPVDVAAIVAALRESGPPWVALAVELLWATGARVGEIAAIRRGDLDLDAGTVRLHGQLGRRRGKTGPRVVGLLPRLVLELAELAGDFAATRSIWPGSPVGLDALVRRHLARACEVAGVERITPHALRRLASGQLLARLGQGVSAQAYVAQMGHGLALGLREYAGARPGEVQLAAQAAGLGEVPAGDVLPIRRGRKS